MVSLIFSFGIIFFNFYMYYSYFIKIQTIDFVGVTNQEEKTIGIIGIGKTKSGKKIYISKYLLKKYKIQIFRDYQKAESYIFLIHKKEKIEGSVTGLRNPENYKYGTTHFINFYKL